MKKKCALSQYLEDIRKQVDPQFIANAYSNQLFLHIFSWQKAPDIQLHDSCVGSHSLAVPISKWEGEARLYEKDEIFKIY